MVFDSIFNGKEVIESPYITGVAKGLNNPLTLGATGSTSHSLTNADVLVSGKLEVNDDLYCDDYVTVSGFRYINIGNGSYIYSGSSPTYGLGVTSHRINFTSSGNLTKAHGHGAQTDPTIFVHSATDPTSDGTQWGSLKHDKANYCVGIGKGGLHIMDNASNGGGEVKTISTVQTTDATVTDIFTIDVSEDEIVDIEVVIMGVKNDGTDRAWYKFAGCYYRDAGGNVTQQVLTPLGSSESDATWDGTVAADTVNQTIDIRVTGKAATTVEWKSRVSYMKIAY